MCESFTNGIEHPNQDTWIHGYSAQLTEAQKKQIADRYIDVPEDVVAMPALFNAVVGATVINHAYRATHESGSRGMLGIGGADAEGESKQLRREYDSLTGRAEKVSDFVLWFSRVSHKAFVAQEQLSPRERFRHVSLELGGIRQYGEWDATKALDRMARGIPIGVLERHPSAKIDIYGRPKDNHIRDERVRYVEDGKLSYRLLPQYRLPSAKNKKMHASAFEKEDLESAAGVAFDFTVIRRRRPVADIYIPGESDIVLFKESIGLLVMSMLHPGMREAIVDDCKRVFDEARVKQDASSRGAVKLDNTPGARLAGALFEDAIAGKSGETKDIQPISAHYVQGVGEKFARFRRDYVNQ